MVNLITDLMWYDALDRTSVLTTRLWSQVGLFVVGFLAFALPAVASIWLARRIAPQVPIRRIGQFEIPDASRAITWAWSAWRLLLALVSAAAWSGSWQTVLLFANGGDFGSSRPELQPRHRLLRLRPALLALPAGLGHRQPDRDPAAQPGCLRGGRACAGSSASPRRCARTSRSSARCCWSSSRPATSSTSPSCRYSTSGYESIQAATYTDMNAQLPAYVILTFVALAAAALLLLNIWFRTLWALALAGGAWFVLSILVGALFPAYVQNFQVNPNELNVERPYIATHIGLHPRRVRPRHDRAARLHRRAGPDRGGLPARTRPTIDNLRLWDYRPLLTTFGQDQILRRYYDFLDVDIDRYQVDGETAPAHAQRAGAGRRAAGRPDARTWTNERLVYTHGYGITAVPVDAVTGQGQPDYLVSGIGTASAQLPVGEPRIYFGEATDTYVVTGTDTEEFDFPLERVVRGRRHHHLAGNDRRRRSATSYQPRPVRDALR